MLATLGILAAERFHPYVGDLDLPGVIVYKEESLQGFWNVVAAVISIVELASIPSYSPFDEGDTWSMKEDRISGDYGFDPLGLKPKTPAELLGMQNKEILNGRLAMI